MDPETLVDYIYEAGAMPEKWPVLLEILSNSFGARAGMLLARTPAGLYGIQSPGAEELRQEYERQGWATDLTRVNWLIRDQYPGFRTDLDYATPDELRQIPLYAKFLIPHGLDAGAATLVDGLDGDQLLLSLEGFADHQTARRAIPKLDRLRPHLARAALLSARLLSSKLQVAIEALQMVGVGAALLGSHNLIRAANALFAEKASELFDDTGRPLRLPASADGGRLAEVIDRAQSGSRGGSVPVRLAHRTIVLHVIPVRGAARELFAGAKALLVAAAGTAGATANEAMARSLYDLTPAEMRVARAIGRGMRVAAIAQAEGVAVSTVRTHVKSIFQKTGVSSQTELALLLSDLTQLAQIEG